MSESLEVMWPRARAWLERVRRAAHQIEPLTREIRGLEEARDEMLPWWRKSSGTSHGHSTHSDPTASEAERRIAELGELIDAKRQELGVMQDVVGALLCVLDAMGDALTVRHARAIELYYIDCAPTWTDVAWEMECGRTTLWKLRLEAYAWIETRCQKNLV